MSNVHDNRWFGVGQMRLTSAKLVSRQLNLNDMSPDPSCLPVMVCFTLEGPLNI